MDIEDILKPIERFLEEMKGTEFEQRVLQMKKEVDEVIDTYCTQLMADGAYEDWLEQD